ncbi:toll/interleukin-1 receptor domain-containing protein [Cryptosporangium aurantiacum]|uniref:WD domain-containing protein, G-beta repeat-containing protein n=1 Tax=Cryptosporangium aurantiacum TaxID=134849 RepID=A0A1M7RJI4_9ACTN|nr:TIR domain-containing protein [Cryptosporangium aurantiacum]SHN46300.1 WD domain-containing protein, G-beta repeat-containing protein [Cryptosporangium aurantiacum]
MTNRIFLSYSTRDRAYVERLAAFLNSAGFDVWWDRELRVGEDWARVVERRIGACAALVVVLSPSAVESKWVRREIKHADDKNKKILPLQLIECAIPLVLCELHIENARGGIIPQGLIAQLGAVAHVPKPAGSVTETSDELPAAASGAATIESVAWSPDGARIATGISGGDCIVWQPDTKQMLFTLSGHVDAVRSVEWSDDGSRIATGSDDGTARIWRNDNGSIEHVLSGHVVDGPIAGPTSTVQFVAWSPDGTRLATGGNAGIVVWDSATWTAERHFDSHDLFFVKALAWSPDGKYLAASCFTGSVAVWVAASYRPLRTRTAKLSRNCVIEWSEDSGRIYIGDDQGHLTWWSPHTKKNGSIASRDVGTIQKIVRSPGEERIAVCAGHTLKIWLTRYHTQGPVTLEGHTGEVNSAAWSPDGDRLVTGSADGTARIWSTRTGQAISVLT